MVKLGDRVCFKWGSGLLQYGRVQKMDHDGKRLQILADDGRMYECWLSDVVSVEKDQ